MEKIKKRKPTHSLLANLIAIPKCDGLKAIPKQNEVKFKVQDLVLNQLITGSAMQIYS